MRCFVHFDFQMCISPQRHAILRHLNRQKWSKHAVFCTFWLSNVHFATAACNFATSKQTKMVQTCGVLYILTFKCAFRHSFVQFFDIWTDKSAPRPSCFVYFHLRMCFSPQRHAIFLHLNRQKCSEAVMFCAFWLSSVLFATAACNFRFRLWALTSAPAALTGLLFDWPDTRIIEKTQHFATSLTFGADVSSFFWLSRYCIFCRLTWRLYCFSTVHIVGSFYLNFLRPFPWILWDIFLKTFAVATDGFSYRSKKVSFQGLAALTLRTKSTRFSWNTPPWSVRLGGPSIGFPLSFRNSFFLLAF